MSDPENFLTRWSRRKRNVADDERAEREQAVPDAPPAERAAIDPQPPSDAAPAPAEPAFDLTKLPSIESITAETDIRPFLAPGVPAELRLAALRRAWVADPKVRDFVGLNDYDFDFHTPGAIPGFGSLEMTDDLRREVARIVGAWQSEAETAAAPAAVTQDPIAKPGTPPAQPAAATKEINAPLDSKGSASPSDSDAGQEHTTSDQDEVISGQATPQRNTESAASQQEHSRLENLQTLARRGHGRALPK